MKTWQHEPNDIPLAQFQLVSSITVFVAVGNVLDKPLFMTAESTNSADFVKFLRLILQKRNDYFTSRKIRLVLDGKYSYWML